MEIDLTEEEDAPPSSVPKLGFVTSTESMKQKPAEVKFHDNPIAKSAEPQKLVEFDAAIDHPIKSVQASASKEVIPDYLANYQAPSTLPQFNPNQSE